MNPFLIPTLMDIAVAALKQPDLDNYVILLLLF